MTTLIMFSRLNNLLVAFPEVVSKEDAEFINATKSQLELDDTQIFSTEGVNRIKDLCIKYDL
jgi:hypothetical protein